MPKDPDLLLAVAAELAVVSLLLAAALIYFLSGKSKRVRELEQELADKKLCEPTISVTDFFDREARLSSERDAPAGKQVKKKKKGPWTLRSQLLNAEKSALLKGGAAPSDISLLEKKWSLMAGVAGNSPEEAVTHKKNAAAFNIDELHSEMQSQLNELQQSLIKRNKTVIELKKRLEELQAKVDLANTEQLIDGLSEDTAITEALAAELEQTKVLYKDALEKIKRMRQNKEAANSMLVVTKNNTHLSDSGISQEDFERLKITVEYLTASYDKAKGELEKLRQSNSEKRKVILALESELRKHGGEISPEVSELVERLKIELRDSKMCTAVLESETDSLREQIQQLREDLNIVEAAQQEASDDQPPEEWQGLDRLAQVLVDTFIEITAASSVEEVAQHLFSLSSDFGIEIGLLLKVDENEYWSSSKGAIDSASKKILKSIAPGQGGDWVDTAKGAVLSVSSCRVLLIDCKTKSAKVNLERFSNAFLMANAAMRRIELQQRSDKQRVMLKQVVKKTKSSLMELDVRYKNLLEQAKDGVTIFKDEFDQFSSNVEFTELQSECVMDIVNDLGGRMDVLFQTSGGMSASYMELIELLDKSEKIQGLPR